MRRRGDVSTADNWRADLLARAVVHGLKKGRLTVRDILSVPWDTQTDVVTELTAMLVRTGAWKAYARTVPVPPYLTQKEWYERP